MLYYHNNDVSKLKSVYAKSYNYVKYVVEKNQSHIRSFLEQVQSGCMKVGTKENKKKQQTHRSECMSCGSTPVRKLMEPNQSPQVNIVLQNTQGQAVAIPTCLCAAHVASHSSASTVGPCP